MSIYAGQQIALLTQHGKERVIGPALEPALGCHIKHIGNFDTDRLGTFTRDIPRPGTQLDAARRKARMGMELSGLSIGIASEGSFGPDPFTGLIPWNVEILMLLDNRLGIEVVGMAQGAGQSGQLLARHWTEVKAFASGEGFPAQHLVLRPEHQDDGRIFKGMTDWNSLQVCFDECIALSANRRVFVETDLRAFANPSRMHQIAHAAQDLLRRLLSCCPACDAPGYGVTERQPGLPCAACGLPTSSYRTEVWQCLRCHHRSVHDRSDIAVADPKHCSRCNP